jgi:hypothetical protein
VRQRKTMRNLSQDRPGVPTYFRIQNLPNTILERYRYSNLLGECMAEKRYEYKISGAVNIKVKLSL